MCFRVCKVFFMGLLKIVVKLLLKAFTWSHQSCIEVFSMQLLVLPRLRVIPMWFSMKSSMSVPRHVWGMLLRSESTYPCLLF